MTSDLLEGAQNRSHERSSERTPKISLIRERSGTTKLPYDRAWRPERNLDKGTESAWSAGREGNPNSESEYERGVGEQLWSPKRASDCSRPEQIGRGNSPFWACPTARILKVAHIGAFSLARMLVFRGLKPKDAHASSSRREALSQMFRQRLSVHQPTWECPA